VLEALSIIGAHLGGRFEVEAIYARLSLPARHVVVLEVGAFGRVLLGPEARGRA